MNKIVKKQQDESELKNTRVRVIFCDKEKNLIDISISI